MFAVPGWLGSSFRGYRRTWVRGDIIGGVTVWALLIPEGLAYAALAGMPAVSMFATGAAGLLAYALFGSSRRVIVSVSSVVATLSAAGVSASGAVPYSDRWVSMTVTLAVLAGVIALAAGVLQLGFLADFVSGSVQSGFLAGLAISIVVKQIAPILGVPGGSGGTLPRLVDVAHRAAGLKWSSVLVALGSAVVILGVNRISRRVPGVFVTLVLAVLAGWALHLGRHDVAMVGAIARGLPGVSMPTLSWARLVELGPVAGGLVLVAFAELVTTARMLADAHNEPLDTDRELIGLGAANIATAFLGGYPGGASLSKSAANEQAGGSTQMAAMVATALTLATALSAGSVFRFLPEPTLAVVVILALRHLLRPQPFVRLFRLQRGEFVLSVLTAAAVVMIGVLPGFVLSVLLSILALTYRTATPRLAILGRDHDGAWVEMNHVAEARAIPGILVVRVAAPMFFATGRAVRDRVRTAVSRADPPVRWLVLDLEETEYLDVGGAEAVIGVLDDMDRRGVGVRLCRVHLPTLELLERMNVLAPGDPRLLPTIPLAVAACGSDASPPRQVRRDGDS